MEFHGKRRGAFFWVHKCIWLWHICLKLKKGSTNDEAQWPKDAQTSNTWSPVLEWFCLNHQDIHSNRTAKRWSNYHTKIHLLLDLEITVPFTKDFYKQLVPVLIPPLEVQRKSDHLKPACSVQKQIAPFLWKLKARICCWPSYMNIFFLTS